MPQRLGTHVGVIASASMTPGLPFMSMVKLKILSENTAIYTQIISYVIIERVRESSMMQ